MDHRGALGGAVWDTWKCRTLWSRASQSDCTIDKFSISGINVAARVRWRTLLSASRFRERINHRKLFVDDLSVLQIL